MNIVCDTNVLISGVLFSGHSREILRLASRGVITNAISPDILEEVEKVLGRQKFGLDPQQVFSIMALFRGTFPLVSSSCRIDVIQDDPDDNRILEAACAAEADFIISGDKHLRDLDQWQDIRIVTPSQFMTGIIGQPTG